MISSIPIGYKQSPLMNQFICEQANNLQPLNNWRTIQPLKSTIEQLFPQTEDRHALASHTSLHMMIFVYYPISFPHKRTVSSKSTQSHRIRKKTVARDHWNEESNLSGSFCTWCIEKSVDCGSAAPLNGDSVGWIVEPDDSPFSEDCSTGFSVTVISATILQSAQPFLLGHLRLGDTAQKYCAWCHWDTGKTWIPR